MVDFKIYGVMDPLPWVTSINPLKAGKRSGFAGHDQHVANPSSASHRQRVHLASHQVELLEAHEDHTSPQKAPYDLRNWFSSKIKTDQRIVMAIAFQLCLGCK